MVQGQAEIIYKLQSTDLENLKVGQNHCICKKPPERFFQVVRDDGRRGHGFRLFSREDTGWILGGFFPC